MKPITFEFKMQEATFPGRLAAYMESEANELAKEWADQVVSVAQAKAPVSATGSHGRLPGRLKRSIKSRKTPTGWFVTVSAPYGVYVEYGTRNQAAQPFFNPALGVARRQFQRKFRTMLRRYKATHPNRAGQIR